MNSEELLLEKWRGLPPDKKQEVIDFVAFLESRASGLVRPDTDCRLCGLLDYCISELQCSPEGNLWHIFKTFICECGWTFLFKDFCFICNRPCKLLVNEQNQLDAENEPAIQFIDGFNIFA